MRKASVKIWPATVRIPFGTPSGRDFGCWIDVWTAGNVEPTVTADSPKTVAMRSDRPTR